MDAVKFLQERKRMCEAQNHCSDCCPAWAAGACKLSIKSGCEADKQVEIVEEWAAAHPRKTRQSVFLEQWPEAKLDEDGIIVICPAVLSKSYSMHSRGACPTTMTTKICADCRRKFWGKVVE